MPDEKFYYDALGVAPPEEGGNEPDPAEPAEEEEAPAEVEETEAGENETDEAPDDPGDAEPSGDDGEGDRTKGMSRAERARQAKLRREQEKQAAIDAAVQAERERIDAELKDAFGWAGFKNGDKPIESLEDFRAYRREAEGRKLERDLKQGKLTPETLREVIAQTVREQQPKPAQQQPDPAFRQKVDAEIREIAKYDPEIQSTQDLLKLDRFEAFQAEVRDHGHSFLEAYRIAYADKIAESRANKAAAAAAQRTQNAIRGKDHLRPVGAKGVGGDAPVPKEEMDLYRQMMPKATDEQIRQHYARYVKAHQ